MTKLKQEKKQASKKPTRDDIKAAVCESIIEAIKKGERVWDRPWIGGGMLPMRVGTRGKSWGVDEGARPYRGINVWHLNHKATVFGYKSAWWGTFNHWREEARKHAIKQGEWKWAETKDGKRYKKPTKNYGIKKGESAVEKMQCVVYWSMIRIKDKDAPKNADKDKTIPIMKWFWVFNRDQTGLPAEPKPKGVKTLKGKRRIKAEGIVDGIIKDNEVDFREGGSKAYFSQSQDYVKVPVREDFKTIEGRLSTILHELTHWTGHSSRLKRDLTGMFGSEDYAREELVAEMGAAILCSAVGVPNKMIEEGLENHAAYMQSWMRGIKEEKDGGVNLVFRAASKAQKACELLMPEFFGYVETKKEE